MAWEPLVPGHCGLIPLWESGPCGNSLSWTLHVLLLASHYANAVRCLTVCAATVEVVVTAVAVGVAAAVVVVVVLHQPLSTP